MPRRQNTGFSLIELMVVIAIVAVLLTLGLPSFQSSLRSNRIATTSNELLASLALARSEAVRSTRGGGVCSSTNGTSCGGDWNSGWLIWTETDGNGVLGAGETVVRYIQSKPKLTLAGSANTIAFDSRGRAIGGAQSIQLNPEGATTPIRCLRIGLTGQTRVDPGACI